MISGGQSYDEGYVLICTCERCGLNFARLFRNCDPDPEATSIVDVCDDCVSQVGMEHFDYVPYGSWTQITPTDVSFEVIRGMVEHFIAPSSSEPSVTLTVTFYLVDGEWVVKTS